MTTDSGAPRQNNEIRSKIAQCARLFLARDPSLSWLPSVLQARAIDPAAGILAACTEKPDPRGRLWTGTWLTASGDFWDFQVLVPGAAGELPLVRYFDERSVSIFANERGIAKSFGALAIEVRNELLKGETAAPSESATSERPIEGPSIQGSCLCGAVQWTFKGMPESATACNCTACRRYGVLWAYDYEGEGIVVSGPTKAYVRGKALGFHFCPTCGCVAYWRGLQPNKEGRRRIAVNLRLTEPEAVAPVPIDHFDGLGAFEDLPRDGRCVRDYWF